MIKSMEAADGPLNNFFMLFKVEIQRWRDWSEMNDSSSESDQEPEQQVIAPPA